MKKINWSAVAFLLALLFACYAGYLSAENKEKEWELDKIRCLNGTYDPCNIRCRSVREVLTGSDGCD